MLLHKWLAEATRTRGSAKALVYRDTYLSWRGLLHRVERRVQEFGAMGIGRGHWVGLMLGNVPDFAILALALSKVGATVVPLDPTTGPRDLSLILEHAPLRALITRPRGGLDANTASGAGADRADRWAGERESRGFGHERSFAAGGHSYWDDDDRFDRPVSRAPAKPALYETRIDSRAETERRTGEGIESRRRLQGTLLTCSIYKQTKEPPGGAGKAAAVLFTNDAAGEPKGLVRTDENLEQVAENAMKALDVTPDDKILTTVPLFHAYGFDLGLVLALRYGATLFLEDDIAPKRIVKLLREQEIDLLPGTPGLYGGLAKLPTAKQLKIKRARYLSGGSALPEETAEAFRERWGLRIIPVYYTTETSMLACDRGKVPTPDSVGKPIEGVELRVGDGKLPAGQTGPLWVRSKAAAKIVVGPSAARIAAATNKKSGEVPVGGTDDKGWLRTGDTGHLDKAGRLFLGAREDHLVKVDGKRVALGEVEGCLEQYPKIHAARVRVVADPLGGPMMVASVVLSGSGKVGAEEIIDHCAKNLAPYKVPRRIEFCETLPA